MKKHNLNVTAGYAYYFRKEARLAAAGRGVSTDLIPTLNASSVPVSVRFYYRAIYARYFLLV